MLPAAAAVILFAVSPAFAQDSDPLADAIRGVDTLWVIVAACLVFFMQAGFALVEAGFTRSKNTVNILFKNVMDFVFASLGFWAIGYAFMFGADGAGFIGTSDFFLSASGAGEGLPVLAFWFFQLVFAGTAATIVSGAMAERTRFVSYLAYSFFITAIIYPIAGHWIWGGGWLANLGFLDFAGSTVVHSIGGWLALIGAIFLGPRIGRFGKNGKTIPGHSVTFATLGVFILWLGWFGFNPGSQLAISGENADAVALVAANTNLAAAAGAVSALILAWILFGKPDIGYTLNGILAGLVAITAPCAFVTPVLSVLIGLVGGVLVVLGMVWLEKLQIDDPVGAVPVHLMNGIWGTLAVGLFAGDGGFFTTGGTTLLVAQLIGIGAVAAWCIGTGVILFGAIKTLTGLRVSEEEEIQGLDFTEHGADAYAGDAIPVGTD
ncbi:MAG: ammonium transporter [Anaerolineales bacterium]|nr:ammonium transporter [Anaerolineales bacterium]